MMGFSILKWLQRLDMITAVDRDVKQTTIMTIAIHENLDIGYLDSMCHNMTPLL